MESINLKDDNFYLNGVNCNHQKDLSSSTLTKLFKAGVIGSKDVAFHLQIVFQGTKGGCVCLVNCNASFRDPKYLAFYYQDELRIIVDKFNLDLLYKEFVAFKKIEEPSDPDKIWEFIKSFTNEELYNKYHQVNY